MSTGNPTPNPIRNTQPENKENPKINPELLSSLAKKTQDILSGHGKPVIDLFNKFIKKNSQKIETATLNDLSPEQQKEIAKMVLIQHGFIEEIIQEGDEDIVLQQIKIQIETQGNANFESGVSNKNETQSIPPMAGFIPDTLKPIDIKSTPKQIEQSPLPQKEEIVLPESELAPVSEKTTPETISTTPEKEQPPNKKIGKRVTPDGIEEYYDEEGKIDTKIFPDGTHEYYWDNKLESRLLPNGIIEKFDWDGSSLGYFNKEGDRISPDVPVSKTLDKNKEEIEEIENRMARRAQEITEIRIALEEIRRNFVPIQTETIKIPEVETFSTEFIKSIVEPLLKSPEAKKKIKKVVKEPQIDGKNEEITLKTTLTLRLPFVPDWLSPDVYLEAKLGDENGVIVIKNLEVQAKTDKVKETVKNEMLPYLDQISEMLKSYIEKEDKKKRKVDKMEIVNGELKVTYK